MRLLRHILLLFLVAFCVTERAQAFSTHCTTVGAAGDVTVTWDKTGINQAIFRSYYLYYSSTAAGPFTLVDSITLFSDTIQTHPFANAYTTAAYYYLTCNFTNGSAAVQTDTIRAMGLIVTNPNNGYAALAWNAVRYPLIATNSPYYVIYKEYPAGTFTVLDSIDARNAPIPMSYNDLISICDDTIKYRVEVMDQSGCKSISPLKGDRFFDRTPPTQPMIDSVSVDLAGNVIIGWVVNSSLDTKLYRFFQQVGGSWNEFDTVYGRSSSILNSTVSASTRPQSIRLIANDSCNNASAPGGAHITVYLENDFSVCDRSITLTWTPYVGWASAPNYEVLVSINGAAEVSLGFTAGLTFTDTSLISGATFCYRIRAHDLNNVARTSTSNRSCFIPVYPPLPAFSYIRRVTVTGSTQVYVSAYVDASASVLRYELQRSLSPAGSFATIATNTTIGVSSISFYDNNVDTKTGPYYYRVVTFDSCGLKSKLSQVSRTIVATAETVDYLNTVSWSTYSDWSSGVDSYNIYESINGVYNPVAAYTVTGASLLMQIKDDVSNLYLSAGEFCYYIEAIQSSGDPNGFLDTVRSNEVCLKVEPIIFIPNAFHPGQGFNTIWSPENSFVSNDGYSLTIFDRWGHEVFKTEDPRKGWDGSLNGKILPVGVYIYQLKAKHLDGSDIVKTGGVTLIN